MAVADRMDQTQASSSGDIDIGSCLQEFRKLCMNDAMRRRIRVRVIGVRIREMDDRVIAQVDPMVLIGHPAEDAPNVEMFWRGTAGIHKIQSVKTLGAENGRR